jgi:hypothetical protein
MGRGKWEVGAPFGPLITDHFDTVNIERLN